MDSMVYTNNFIQPMAYSSAYGAYPSLGGMLPPPPINFSGGADSYAINQPQADGFYSNTNTTPYALPKQEKKSFWTKPGGIATIIGAGVIATIAAVCLRNNKINKTFENTVEKLYDNVFEDMSSMYKKQGLDIQKPKIEYIDEFTGEDISALASYHGIRNTIKVNKAYYMQKTYRVQEKGKTTEKFVFGDLNLNKHIGKDKDKFVISELTNAEKEICLNGVLAHEIEHTAQFHAMLNYDKNAALKYLAKEKDIETLKGTFAYDFQPSKQGENFVFNYGNTFSKIKKSPTEYVLGYDTKSLVKGLETYPKGDKSYYYSEPIEIGARLRALSYLEGKYGDLTKLPENVKEEAFINQAAFAQKGMTDTQILVQLLKDSKPEYAPDGTSNRLTFLKK